MMKRLLFSIWLLSVCGCGSHLTLENIQQHIDNYYQSEHPTWSAKKSAVEKGRATMLMTLTEVRLATSVRKINNAGYALADFYFDEHGCWYGDTSTKAGGLLWWTVNQRKSLSYYGGIVEIPEYTYYFKWEDNLDEYMCYDWVQW